VTAHQRIDRPAEAAGSNRLPILAATINEHLEAAENAARRGLEHAIAAGKLLLEAKALVALASGSHGSMPIATSACGKPSTGLRRRRCSPASP
jgi:hypothetical protein